MHQLFDGGFRQAQLLRQGGVAKALPAHSGINGHLGRHQRRYRNQFLPLLDLAGEGQIPIAVKVAAQGRHQAVVGLKLGFRVGVAPGVGPVHIRKTNRVAAVAALLDFAGIGVTHS